MKTGFVITGRLKSTRLPKKLLLELHGRPMIEWMIKRAKLVFPADDIVIATSTHPQDDALEEIANRLGIRVFRGYEEDVIMRLYEAAQANGFDAFINITADCPLFGYDYLTRFFEQLFAQEADLVTSLELPHGIFTYCLRTKALQKVIELKKTDNTEVWGTYFYDNPSLFKVIKHEASADEIRPNFRLTVDYPEDFEVFEAIFSKLGENAYQVSSHDLIQLLDEHPEIVAINQHCRQQYITRWESQKATELEKK